MTISDKIRVYELSRDLNLDNKDIIDAAQKLSISVKSHSSSISLTDANKIKNLFNKNNPNEKIISLNKSSIKSKPNNLKNTNTNSVHLKSNQEIVSGENLNKKPLLIRPVTKPNNPLSNTNKKIQNKIETTNNPIIATNRTAQTNLKVC